MLFGLVVILEGLDGREVFAASDAVARRNLLLAGQGLHLSLVLGHAGAEVVEGDGDQLCHLPLQVVPDFGKTCGSLKS